MPAWSFVRECAPALGRGSLKQLAVCCRHCAGGVSRSSSAEADLAHALTCVERALAKLAALSPPGGCAQDAAVEAPTAHAESLPLSSPPGAPLALDGAGLARILDSAALLGARAQQVADLARGLATAPSEEGARRQGACPAGEESFGAAAGDLDASDARPLGAEDAADAEGAAGAARGDTPGTEEEAAGAHWQLGGGGEETFSAAVAGDLDAADAHPLGAEDAEDAQGGAGAHGGAAVREAEEAAGAHRQLGAGGEESFGAEAEPRQARRKGADARNLPPSCPSLRSPPPREAMGAVGAV